MPELAKRVLIYRLGSLGDTVVALPVLHLIDRAFPGTERRMLTNFPVSAKAPAAAAVLDGSGLVNGYLRYIVGTRSPLALLWLGWNILRFRPDVLVYLAAPRGLEAARRDARFFRVFGIRRIVGLPDSETMQRNLPLRDGRFEPEAARLARCVAELGDARLQEPESWDLRLTVEERKKAARLISEIVDRGSEKRFFAFSLGTKVQVKEWGVARWRELWRSVAERFPGWGLVILGAENERKLSEEAVAEWRQSPKAGPVVNLCGMSSPRESAAVMELSTVFVGHDSGPSHLAAAVGTHVVAVFASRNLPGVWFPYGGHVRVLYHEVSCQGCNLDVCTVERKRCIYSITVDEVLQAIVAQAMQES
jgi:ADP-heptose:LPS heptosyltransferase